MINILTASSAAATTPAQTYSGVVRQINALEPKYRRSTMTR
jgi:hypothetical protein